jgi:hypothetical protein
VFLKYYLFGTALFRAHKWNKNFGLAHFYLKTENKMATVRNAICTYYFILEVSLAGFDDGVIT